MSTLNDRLDRIRKGFAEHAPEAVLAVMRRATDSLRASGILDRIPKPGDPLPPFELPDTEGDLVRSAEILSRGPLVLAFYRGLW